MELHAFMGLRDLASAFLLLLAVETDLFIRVLDKCGIWGPKDRRRLHVDVDFGLLKLVGLRSGFSCVRWLHRSRRMARSMGSWRGIPNYSSLSPPSL
jgi:hypothetical protein